MQKDLHMSLKLTRTTKQDDNTIVLYPNGSDEDEIIVKVVHMQGGQVVLSIDAPDHTEIVREELLGIEG